MQELTITIPLPPKQMRPNSRTHWRAKMGPKAQQRQEAYLSAKAAIGRLSPPRWSAASIEAEFYLGRRGKQNDRDNLIAWLKATADGLEDAGVVADDAGFTWMPPRQVFGKDAPVEKKVVLTIREAK